MTTQITIEPDHTRKAMSVNIGDWIEINIGVAHQVLEIDRVRDGRLRFGFVKGQYLYASDYDIVDVLTVL